LELARHGTVFLDEVGDLPLEMQPKLLRVIEDKEFERVGGTRIIQSDFRIIAATNQNLEEMLIDNRFRKDLFYRLNVIPLHIPPLRARKNDILPTARHLLKQIAGEANLAEIKIDKEPARVLKNYAWPGNVRELFNVLERTTPTLAGDTIYLENLPFYLHHSRQKFTEQYRSSLKDVQATTEKEAICRALQESGNNKAKAARILGIHRTQLYKKMKKFHVPL
jgi:transcriptional regulator with PAS, ATPase and Fis domain